MVEGKPYRYGLIVAGLCVAVVGLFIMVQEQPHIYATLCGLGVFMVCIGTAWSLCQCYPKVVMAPQIKEENTLEDSVYTSAETNQQSCAAALTGFHGDKRSTRLLPEVLTNNAHSCPTLHLV